MGKMILGIDGSVKSTGVALVDGESGEVIAYDLITTKPKDFDGREDMKIHHIATTIVEICKQYNVTHIAIENSYVSANSRSGNNRTSITLARLHGGLSTLLIENGFTLIYDYMPSSWRKVVTGHGNKSKEGAGKWIRMNVIDIGEYSDKSNKDKTSDMYDAIGLATCLYKKLNNIK